MTAKDVDAIVIHCSASREGQDIKAADIRRMHVHDNGWKDIGYHWVIDLDGTIEKGRPETMTGAHCNTKGLSKTAYNSHSIGVCYVGGCDKFGKPKDTRTLRQKEAMRWLIADLVKRYPNVKEVLGHRDCSPDKNGDGKITSNEFIKACPCFDVRAEFPEYQKNKK